MGLTPMEGLIMGTRCGDIDPGLLLHLMKVQNISIDEVDKLLNHRSGLLGLSGRSADMRELHDAADKGDHRAAAALEAFAYRVRKYIGSYAAALGGIEAIAFTGGIGEHSAPMRSRICNGLQFIGVNVDPSTNQTASGDEPKQISPDTAAVEMWVVPTDEELQIARELFELFN
jgi:acetate kinase